MVSRYSLDKILKVKVTIARSNVKSRSHHDNTYLHPLINVPIMYQTSYTLRFLRYSPDKILNSRSLRQGQRLNRSLTTTLHTYTPQSMSLPSFNFLYLTVTEIQPGQTFSGTHPPVRTLWVKINYWPNFNNEDKTE